MIRNNRDAYYHPTPADVATLREDKRNVQWRNVHRIACRASGKPDLTAWQVHQLLGLTPLIDNVQMHGKPVWGWWRFQ